MENEDVTRELGEEDPAIEANYREGWDSVATDDDDDRILLDPQGGDDGRGLIGWPNEVSDSQRPARPKGVTMSDDR